MPLPESFGSGGSPRDGAHRDAKKRCSMAMIEVSDLVAPFQKGKRTHLVSMILAVALFVAFRLADGGMTLSILNGGRSQPSAKVPQSTASFLEERDELSGKRAKASASSAKTPSGFIERDDDFDTLSLPNSKKSAEEDEVVDAFGGAPTDDGKQGGFADIERELGLR